MRQRIPEHPIAIVGMACRLPDADDLDAYWDLLREGRSAVRELPPDRLDRTLYFDPHKGTRGRTYSSLGGVIGDRPLDLELLPSPAVLQDADPCHQIFCEVVGRACVHAGYDPKHIADRRTGVYVGHSGGSPLGGELAFGALAEETADLLCDAPSFRQLSDDVRQTLISGLTQRLRHGRPRRGPDGSPNVEANMVAGLVARTFGFGGPHVAVDAACASSLVALALGAMALDAGEIDMAVVGGASFNKVDSLVLFSQAQSCSAIGSRPFDAEADGLISSEGYVAVLMKTLERAMADGDRVYGVVRGIGMSSDGRGRSLWAPRQQGQLAAIQRAYHGGIDPREVGFIEAHATSTELGDATELNALAEFFGPLDLDRRLPLGSVKSNLGHTLETAGLASLLKVLLAIKHEQIPPTINYRKPNERIDWDRVPFYVESEITPWPCRAERARRAAVNAFGIGGLNVHLVVDEYVAEHSRPGLPAIRKTDDAPRRPQHCDEADIAVIGRGVVLPGAKNLDEFAELVRSGADALSEAPAERWRCPPSPRGGFITDFHYDWQKHKVPPLQLRRANPLQFMLLDAASQTLEEAKYDRRPFDRATAAVVIGTLFGGEFGNHLHIGVRFPEVRRELRECLEEQGIRGRLAEVDIERLLDEYERAFFEARPALLDDTGSFTSSTLASRIGKTLDLMGGAMALDAGECSSPAALWAAIQLLRSGTCSMVLCGGAQRAMDRDAFQLLSLRGCGPTAHGDGYVLGEGVAMVLLKRLDDARRDNDPVHAVIRDVDLATDHSDASSADVSSDPLIRQIGHTKAAHGLAALVRGTLLPSHGRITLKTHNVSGLEGDIPFEPVASPPEPSPEVLRIHSPPRQSRSPRAAFLFPGQGSQYPDMLRALVQSSPAARKRMEEADSVLRQMGSPTFAQLAWDDPERLGTDLWATQAAVLVADLICLAEAEELGISPFCVAGHSFGEIAALVAAGCWSLEQALRVTRARVDAMSAIAGIDTAMLAVHAAAESLQPRIEQHSGLFISHYNAPDVTVVAGARTAVQDLAEALDEERISTQPLSVPCAFHTPYLAPAQQAFSRAIAQEPLLPPSIPLLSSVTNRFVAEPKEIRQNLVAQLVEPLRFVELVQRLGGYGVTRFVELGPKQVLTGLVRSILPDRSVTCFALDHPKRSAQVQRARLIEVLGASAATSNRPARLPSRPPSCVAPLEEFDATKPRREDCRQRSGEQNGHTADSVPNDDLERFLVDFVVEHTGYPPEVVSLDADLEADLGIDSIKKAQLFGELREMVGLEAEEGRAALQTLCTLQQILEMAQAATPAGEAAAEPIDDEPEFQHQLQTPHYLQGLERGRRDAEQVRGFLRQQANVVAADVVRMPPARDDLVTVEREQLRGLADGAGVHFNNVLAHTDHLLATDRTNPAEAFRDEHITSRFVLRTVALPQRVSRPPQPRFHGGAMVVGSNEVATALVNRLRGAGVNVAQLESADDPQENVRRLERAWQQCPILHLFLVTPRDRQAVTTFDWSSWQVRRNQSVLTPFLLCRKWIELAERHGSLNDVSLVGVTSLGGQFGFTSEVVAAESGALAGLLKAIRIENWVNGFRATPVKVIDAASHDHPEEIVEAVWRELAVPCHDMEIAWHGGIRKVVRAVPCPTEQAVHDISEGGTWVCTGGARGITAYVAGELARRYDLKLHLIGLSPEPHIADSWRTLDVDDPQRLKAEIMRQAQSEGANSVAAWQSVQRALEIDRTLRELDAMGVQAVYHSCDVAEREQLAELLQTIRDKDGPIDGVLHGAGVGRDARFGRKDMRKVGQCIRAKVDGTLALMDLTRCDPLKFFVAFGSISGRFGANGQTDYSMANDMLARQIGWYRRQRPEVAAVAFHWHAWGEVGMATKPESRLALEMIDMQFMPAEEGVEHLLAELKAAAPEPEVLITDDRYYRTFNPWETRAFETYDSPTPEPLEAGHLPLLGEDQGFAVELDPTSDPFLIHHRVDDRPVLPLVVGMELLAEAAVRESGVCRRLRLRDIEAVQALKFFDDTPRTARVRITPQSDGMAAELLADVRTREGQLVESDRTFLRAVIEPAAADITHDHGAGTPPAGRWEDVSYGPRDGKVYHGPPLRTLIKFQSQPRRAWGRISAPTISELAGAHRDVHGWLIPCAVLDACFYATGLLAWRHVEPGPSLPVRIGSLDVARLTDPGEDCLVEATFRRRDDRHAWFDFVLRGSGGETILAVRDYCITWLGGS